MINMKALVLEDKGVLRLTDTLKPIPKADELLIRTKAATICTSDINDIKYNSFGIRLPMIMGHEGSGIVEQVGASVKEFKVGDEVAVHPVVPCGVCGSCKAGFNHLCENMGHLGIDRGGVFAEYFTIRADRARLKSQGISFADATLMEPLCVCIEAIERACVNKNSNVLIIGDGPFGVIIAKLCELYSEARVIVVGRHDFRLGYIKNAVTINDKKTSDIVNEIMNASNKEGIDSAILCVGTNEALDIAIEVMRARGTIAVFSAIAGKASVDMFKVHVKELNICGSCNDMNYIDRALEYLEKYQNDFTKMITHQFAIEAYKEAFELAEKGKDTALKVSFAFE